MGENSLIDQTIIEYGDPTLINRLAGLNGMWSEADAGRSQMFLQDADLHKPAWEVTLSTAALSAPYNVKLGSEITNQKHGWVTVVVKLERTGVQGIDASLFLLTIAAGR
jgi:hypothetical protein